jgi:hypothetical protein
VQVWRRLHNEELHNQYISPNIIRVIKSRRMRWAGYVACTEKMSNSHKMLVRKSEQKRPLRRPKHRLENIRIKLRGIKWVCTGHIWLRRGASGRPCEKSNEHLGSIKGMEFLD